MSNPMHRPSKSFNPGLRSGVSAESPENFHLKYINILDSHAKNSLIAGKDKNPGFFLSNLKKNKVLIKPKFHYEDLQSSGFDYDSLKFVECIDLIQNDEERIRCKTPFYQK